MRSRARCTWSNPPPRASSTTPARGLEVGAGVVSSVQARMGVRVMVGAGTRVRVRGGATSDFANFSPIILSTV